MDISGRVHNGVVILDGHPALPEGLLVTVTVPVIAGTGPGGSNRRISLPLVPGRSGAIDLTAERIADLLDDDDVSA